MAKSNLKSQKKDAKPTKALNAVKGVVKAAIKIATQKSTIVVKAGPKKPTKSPVKTTAKKPLEKKAAEKPLLTSKSKTPSIPTAKATTTAKAIHDSSKVHSKNAATTKPTPKQAPNKIEAKGSKKSEPPKIEIKPGTVDKTAIKKGQTAIDTESLGDDKTSLAASSKSTTKSPTKKKSAEKKEEFALEDDLVGETEDFVSDELSEYQAELENAVEDVEEKDVTIDEAALSTSPAPVYKEKAGEVVLTDAEGRRYCRVKDCDQVETVDAYCRFHYLLLWKKIQIRKKILTDGKLERYVEELTSRYPDKFLEVIRRDLRSEKDFVSAIQEMEIDESSPDNEFEDESSNFIDEVRSASNESLVEDDDY